MVSPFAGFENATLTLQIPGDAVALVDGNWVAERTTQTYSANLKPSSPRTRNEPGIDGADIFLKGYLIDPQWFPDTVQLPLKVACTINMQNGGTQSGILEIQATPSSGFGVEAITGQKIEGYLKIEDGN